MKLIVTKLLMYTGFVFAGLAGAAIARHYDYGGISSVCMAISLLAFLQIIGIERHL